MPFTIITVKNSPQRLRGDLTKWMQEIATGVYVGNFNVKIREELWKRVVDSVGSGEATLSYAYRNEVGYHFETHNTNREIVHYDGIPLVLIPNKKERDDQKNDLKPGFSRASKYAKGKKFSNPRNVNPSKEYVVIDIETDGLDIERNHMIEIGAFKICGNKTEEFSCLLEYKEKLPQSINQLTSITDEMLKDKGRALQEVLPAFLEFIGTYPIVGYHIDFDLGFLNKYLHDYQLPKITNLSYDLLRYVKKEKKYLDNYKLTTVLKAYGLENTVPHRALQDAKQIWELSLKVNRFLKALKKK